MCLAEAAAGCCFQRLAVPGFPAVAPGGRGSTGPGVVLPGRRGGSGWSAGGVGLQAGDRGGELAGPGPGGGEAQPQRGGRRGRGARRRRTGAAAAVWVPRRGRRRRGRASASRPVSSLAMATSSHQIWFWSKPCSGRLRSPVSLAQRMRSSHRARRRWRSSRSASCPRRASVAKAVNRCPSMSVNRSCAPGWGRSLRTITRIPSGQPGQVQQAGQLGHPRTRPHLAAGVIGGFPDPVRAGQGSPLACPR